MKIYHTPEESAREGVLGIIPNGVGPRKLTLCNKSYRPQDTELCCPSDSHGGHGGRGGRREEEKIKPRRMQRGRG